jgi:hypothetical protein
LGFCKQQNKRQNINIGFLKTTEQETKHKHWASANNKTRDQTETLGKMIKMPLGKRQNKTRNINIGLLQTTEQETKHKHWASANNRTRDKT